MPALDTSRAQPPRSRPIRSTVFGLAALLLVVACAAAAESDPASGQGSLATPIAGPSSAVAVGEGSSPAASPAATADGASPAASATPLPTPGPTLERVPALQPPAYASRIVVPGLGIDLPVISGDTQPPPNYPLCDVAAYVTRFSQPYESGVTYISAHAQRGMFLPLLQASQRNDGAEMLGMRVEVYTDDGRRYDYRVEQVVRHALDYGVLAGLPLEDRNLILQTSEGPYGTLEKLQVVASFEAEAEVDVAQATPVPEPRDCRPPELR